MTMTAIMAHDDDNNNNINNTENINWNEMVY